MWTSVYSTLQKDNNKDKFIYIIKLQELFYMKIFFKNNIAYFYSWWDNLTALAPAVICHFTLQHFFLYNLKWCEKITWNGK